MFSSDVRINIVSIPYPISSINSQLIKSFIYFRTEISHLLFLSIRNVRRIHRNLEFSKNDRKQTKNPTPGSMNININVYSFSSHMSEKKIVQNGIQFSKKNFCGSISIQNYGCLFFILRIYLINYWTIFDWYQSRALRLEASNILYSLSKTLLVGWTLLIWALSARKMTSNFEEKHLHRIPIRLGPQAFDSLVSLLIQHWRLWGMEFFSNTNIMYIE